MATDFAETLPVDITHVAVPNTPLQPENDSQPLTSEEMRIKYQGGRAPGPGHGDEEAPRIDEKKGGDQGNSASDNMDGKNDDDQFTSSDKEIRCVQTSNPKKNIIFYV